MADVARDTIFRIGLDPADRVILMENHDQAYYTWRDAGVKQKILIHIDAHHDMWWVKDKAPITIADFICPVVKEDIVREVFWVVPDATLETTSGRKGVLQRLKKISRKYPGERQRVKVGDKEISLVVLGKALRVCSLRSLPRIEESVRLDIDTDYMVIPWVTLGEMDEHGTLPWCWPGELVGQLAAQEIRAEMVTLVYSVEGGYTPPKWKYLGDEVALRLERAGAADGCTEGYTRMREAAEAAARGDAVAAEAKCREAAELLPRSAAAY